jgi:tRNA nucleotidyltransferase (CCA-adding enzyme)
VSCGDLAGQLTGGGIFARGPIAIPEPVLAILRRIEAAGYETWCVGGAIRDALAGNPHQDLDLATAAKPEVVRTLFPRTIAVGMEHGTVGVLDDDGVLHEVTTFRRDVTTDGRHAVVEFGVSLDDDLARRDFTINAIAYHPIREEWRDPFHGYDDFFAGVVRAVGDPAQRFQEDRLRILRALRFAARFNFTIEPATWSAALAQAGDTGHLSAERVRDEWVKGIATAQSIDRLVQLWWDSGVTRTWMPECHLPGPHQTTEALRQIAERDPVRATAIFCAPNAPVWRRFKGSNAEIHRAEAIDRGPVRPPSADPRDVRRWLAAVGAAADDLRMLALWRGDNGDGWTSAVDEIRARGEATSRSSLAITGHDLIGAGIPPGVEIGRTLERLLDLVLGDPGLNTRERLLRLAKKDA